MFEKFVIQNCRKVLVLSQVEDTGGRGRPGTRHWDTGHHRLQVCHIMMCHMSCMSHSSVIDLST